MSGTSIRLSNILVDTSTLNVTNTNNTNNLVVSSNTSLSGNANILQLSTTTASSSGFNFLSTRANSVDILTISGLGNLSTSGVLTTTNSSVSTNTTTGALIVTGGVGIGGNTNIGGTVISTGNVLIGATGVTATSELHLHKGTNTTVSLRITDSTTGSTATDGFSLFKDASSNGNIWNYENAQLIFGTNNTSRMTVLSTGEVSISSTANSTSTTTGSLRLSGGLGVSGNIYYSGTLQGVSDITVKDIISDLEPTLKDINSIRCIKYKRKDTEEKETEIGFIAQEINKLYPEISKIDCDGKYTLDYSRFTVILLNCIKELNEKITKLENKVK